MALVNATKMQRFLTPRVTYEYLLAALTFLNFYFTQECTLFCKWVLVIDRALVRAFLYSLPYKIARDKV
jgi:hypothetical protein